LPVVPLCRGFPGFLVFLVLWSGWAWWVAAGVIAGGRLGLAGLGGLFLQPEIFRKITGFWLDRLPIHAMMQQSGTPPARLAGPRSATGIGTMAHLLIRNNPSACEALKLMGVYTGGRFGAWALAGGAKASCRADIMSALAGKRIPQSKSGVNALNDALYAAVGVKGGCPAECERRLRRVARACLRMGILG
jgi:hypothetical protein